MNISDHNAAVEEVMTTYNVNVQIKPVSIPYQEFIVHTVVNTSLVLMFTWPTVSHAHLFVNSLRNYNISYGTMFPGTAPVNLRTSIVVLFVTL